MIKRLVQCCPITKTLHGRKTLVTVVGLFVRILFVALLILSTEASFGQSRFKDEADSLQYWNQRRFVLDGEKPYTKEELERMNSAAPIHQQSLKTGTDTAKTKQDSTASMSPTWQGQYQRDIRIPFQSQSFREPFVAVSPSDQYNFVSAYQSSNSGVRWVYNSYTTDGGVTWSIGDIPIAWRLYESGFDPVVAFDAEGSVYYVYGDAGPTVPTGQNAIAVGKSFSRGATWSDFVPLQLKLDL